MCYCDVQCVYSVYSVMCVSTELNQAAVIDVGEEERVREQIEREKYK